MPVALRAIGTPPFLSGNKQGVLVIGELHSDEELA
jgi:hypothetical protein